MRANIERGHITPTLGINPTDLCRSSLHDCIYVCVLTVYTATCCCITWWVAWMDREVCGRTSRVEWGPCQTRLPTVHAHTAQPSSPARYTIDLLVYRDMMLSCRINHSLPHHRCRRRVLTSTILRLMTFQSNIDLLWSILISTDNFK